ncbi:hypothetical protein [Streptomyces sp. NBC_00385]|uniref:hypothetical protein n=1 Tax=Streptomyces sp. NBC_00385 TaxID=2975733 RepID=UPI002DDA0A24|nr:hypothetical protein [Streptomyces sp. NBC_00385]WRZ05811.1 hypothetical protein OG959_21940 [Streptomyces sp. NBC_00385]
MRRHVLWGTVAASVVMTVLGASPAHAEGRGDIRVVKSVANNGKSVVVGIRGVVTIPVKLTIKDNSGVKGVGDLDAHSAHTTYGAPAETVGVTCKKLSSTTSDCTGTLRFDPAWFPGYSERSANEGAGDWVVYGVVNANDRDYWIYDALAPFTLKRAATLKVSAMRPDLFGTSKQVKVTGALARADWEALKYRGYGGQSVKLQFRKAGAASYTTVKTVRTNSAGQVSTTVTAPASGTWRWYYPGTSTTSQTASAGDTVSFGPLVMRSSAAKLPLHDVSAG